MDYFKKYGLNEEDINEIENYIEDDDINNYYVNELEIIQILDYLTEIGLNNIKDILKYKTNIFYEKLNNIVNRYGNQTKAVIITDSLEKKKDCPYGIQTFNRGELDNIAAKLLKIMKEGK